MTFDYGPGATALDPDEAEGLIPTHISTIAQLNQWEHSNILDAEEWAFSHKRPNVLTAEFIRELHRRMFEVTWNWAGTYRRSDKNIGVHWTGIGEAVRNMSADVQTWIDNRVISPQEVAVMLHLRCVQIHPFPNGNGRHARLLADVLLHQQGHERLPWGGQELQHHTAIRDTYLSALKSADAGDLGPLLQFAVT